MGQVADIARQYLEAVNAKDPESARHLLAEGYTYTGPDGETRRGPQAAVDVMNMYLRAFPDVNLDVRSIHEAGDVAVVEYVFRGTHKGELEGIQPTGQRAELTVCNVIEFRGGQVVAEREYFDQLSLLRQLGVAPEAGAMEERGGIWPNA